MSNVRDIAADFSRVFKYAAELQRFGKRPILTEDQAAMVDMFHETRDPRVLSILADHLEENGSVALGQLLRYGVEYGEVTSTPRNNPEGIDYPKGFHPHVVTGYNGRRWPDEHLDPIHGIIRLATPDSASHNHVVKVPVHRADIRDMFSELGETPDNHGYSPHTYSSFYRGTDLEG